MKQFAFISFLCLISIGRMYAQNQRADSYQVYKNEMSKTKYYDARDINKFLTNEVAKRDLSVTWKLRIYKGVGVPPTSGYNMNSDEEFQEWIVSFDAFNTISKEGSNIIFETSKQLDNSGLYYMYQTYSGTFNSAQDYISGTYMSYGGWINHDVALENGYQPTWSGNFEMWKIEDEIPTPTLSVAPSSLSFVSAGEQKTFTLTSNTDWTVDSSDSWITVSPSSGSNNGNVTVTATANTATTQRTATITVSGTGVSAQTISITQAAASVIPPTPTLSVAPSALSFVSAGEQKAFTVTSNTDWTVDSSDSWITVSPTAGSNNATVTVTATANTATTQRTATITVSGTGVSAQTISITQAAASVIPPTPTLSVAPSSLSFVSASEQKAFTVTSNTNWTVTGSDSWITVSPSSGSNNATVTVTATANTATTQRTATITVNGTGVTAQTISIMQTAASVTPPTPTLSVAPSSLSFVSAGEQKTFAVTSNTSWTASSSNPWVTVSPASGSNNATVTVTATANTATTQRTATITVSGTGVSTQTISITQVAGKDENVDWVLINGVKWATRNVGAPGSFVQNPEDYGGYYQWYTGTTDLLSYKNYYSFYATGSWSDPSPSGYRMPTFAEIQSLVDATYVKYEWINGGKFTDKTSGKSIFLPAAGSRDPFTTSWEDVGAIGMYWSNTYYGSDYPYLAEQRAYSIYFYDGKANFSWPILELSIPIRPVVDDAQPNYSMELLSVDDIPVPMKGVCADGLSQLRIRLKSSVQNPDVKSIKFNLVRPDYEYEIPGNEYGFLGTAHQELIINNPTFIYQNGESYFDISYFAPDDIDCIPTNNTIEGNKLAQIAVKTEITTSNGYEWGITLPSLTINIIRPPLLMVHGLGGSPDTFSAMTSLFQTNPYSPYYWWQLLPLDYSTSNTASFSYNQLIVPFGIIQLLENCRKFGYEARTVDIVAHSMGGLLTRQYIQSSYYSYDINKFITLNTPESGSQGANLLMQIDEQYGQYTDLFNAFLHIYFMTDESKWEEYDFKRDEYYNKLTNFLRQGAVRDLCVDSYAITDSLNGLNGKELNKNTVPTHAIYTTSTIKEELQDNINKKIIITGLKAGTVVHTIYGLIIPAIIFSNSELEDLNSFTTKLYGEDNDIIVPVTSQIGRLDNKGGNKVTTFFPDQWHCSTDNPDVINRVQELLISSKTSGLFSINGFNPPRLTYNNPIQLSTKSLRTSSQDTYIKFTSIDKPNCMNSDNIKIQITGSPDITSMTLYIQGEYGNNYIETDFGNSNVFSYTVPEDALGYKKLLAIGYTGSQTTVIDTASITVSTLASLLSISTSENELWVPLYGKQQVLVQGSYSDGTNKNITFLDDVQYKIKGSNTGLESPNIVVGKAEGVDTLLISCRGLETYLPIQIVDVGLLPTPTAIESPIINNQKQLSCYPNPAKDQVTVSFEFSKPQTQAFLSIYGLTGQVIKQIELKNRGAGIHEEVISVGYLSKGIYIVVLSTKTGNISYVKLIKE